MIKIIDEILICRIVSIFVLLLLFSFNRYLITMIQFSRPKRNFQQLVNNDKLKILFHSMIEPQLGALFKISLIGETGFGLLESTVNRVVRQ